MKRKIYIGLGILLFGSLGSIGIGTLQSCSAQDNSTVVSTQDNGNSPATYQEYHYLWASQDSVTCSSYYSDIIPSDGSIVSGPCPFNSMPLLGQGGGNSTVVAPQDNSPTTGSNEAVSGGFANPLDPNVYGYVTDPSMAPSESISSPSPTRTISVNGTDITYPSSDSINVDSEGNVTITQP